MSYAAHAHYTPALGGVWREVLHGRRLHTAHRRRRVYGRLRSRDIDSFTTSLNHVLKDVWDIMGPLKLRYIEACIGPWKMFIWDLPVSDTQSQDPWPGLSLTNSPISPLWLLVNPYDFWFPHANDTWISKILSLTGQIPEPQSHQKNPQ